MGFPRAMIVHNYYRKRYRGGEDIVFDNEFAYMRDMYKDNIFSYTACNEDIKKPSIMLNLPYSHYHAARIGKIVKDNKIQIMHVHNIFYALTPSIIRSAKNAGAKVIMTLHNFRWWCPNGALFNPATMQYCSLCSSRKFPSDAVKYKCLYDSRAASGIIAVLTYIYKCDRITDLIDKFIVLSENSKKEIIQFGINSKRIEVKPNFTDLQYQNIKREKSDNYLYIGRLDAYKGFRMLMNVWEQFGHGHLTVIGNGPLLEEYSEKYSHSGNVKFLGKCRRETVIEEIRKTGFLIMPSLMHENFPLTILEAMSQGIPVISTDMGMRREIVNKDNGILFNPDEESMIDALNISSHIDNKQYDHLSRNAYNDSLKYSKENIMKHLENIYRGIL